MEKRLNELLVQLFDLDQNTYGERRCITDENESYVLTQTTLLTSLSIIYKHESDIPLQILTPVPKGRREGYHGEIHKAQKYHVLFVYTQLAYACFYREKNVTEIALLKETRKKPHHEGFCIFLNPQYKNSKLFIKTLVQNNGIVYIEVYINEQP